MRQLVLLFVCLSACSYAPNSLNRSGGASAPPAQATSTSSSFEPYDGGYWLQLSADDSTSMASAQLARIGQFDGLHRHEFLNYYDPAPELFDVEPWATQAALNESIKMGASLVLSTDADGGTQAELLLQMRALPVAPETRRPWHLVYCVDVSGSMSGEKISFTRDALKQSLVHLRDGDRVSLVTFSDNAETRVSFAKWPQDQNAIRAAIDGLQATNGTNMIEGLNRAYDVAGQHQNPNTLSRVLLFGDGQANIGDTDVQRFSALTRNGNGEGIYLSSVGVGTDFDWNRMDQLADSGKGASIFLPDAQEVARMFGRDFYKLVEVSADEVSVELVLNDGFTLVDFSGEETSTDPSQRVPSTILSSGDDLTILAKFNVTPEALAAPLSLRVSFKTLGTGELVTHDKHFVTAQELVSTSGTLHKRTRLVDDYARSVIGSSPSKADVSAAITAFGTDDTGLAEILNLLGP